MDIAIQKVCMELIMRGRAYLPHLFYSSWHSWFQQYNLGWGCHFVDALVEQSGVRKPNLLQITQRSDLPVDLQTYLLPSIYVRQLSKTLLYISPLPHLSHLHTEEPSIRAIAAADAGHLLTRNVWGGCHHVESPAQVKVRFQTPLNWWTSL